MKSHIGEAVARKKTWFDYWREKVEREESQFRWERLVLSLIYT